MVATPRVPVSAVNHVGITVNDLYKTMEEYWNILGIGPWMVFTYGSPEIPDLECYGRPAYGKYRAGIALLGSTELELIETIEGTSIFRDWTYQHGESLHHVKFIVEDLNVERVSKEMENLGFPKIMGGHVGSEDRWQFAYFDTSSALHAIWETSNRMGGKLENATTFPEDPTAISPAKLRVLNIRQVALVVRDAVRTAQNYWRILGIGPWSIYDWGTHVLDRRIYHGRPSWGREIAAFAPLGDFQLELVQPVEGDSIYQDWLDVHGEGLHHLKFLCDDVDDTAKKLTDQGFLSILSGHYGAPGEKAGGYYYINIPPLHCVWEPVQEPKNMPAEPFSHIP